MKVYRLIKALLGVHNSMSPRLAGAPLRQEMAVLGAVAKNPKLMEDPSTVRAVDESVSQVEALAYDLTTEIWAFAVANPPLTPLALLDLAANQGPLSHQRDPDVIRRDILKRYPPYAPALSVFNSLRGC